MSVNKLKTKTGDQIASVIGILSVLPKARDKSLRYVKTNKQAYSD